ncbi:hypothetical protein J2W51_000337 [Tardiphaga robiniae]|jgi:hypothetical protein|nr:hypothetical protein [Tardiphaga robiniae]
MSIRHSAVSCVILKMNHAVDLAELADLLGRCAG